MEAMSNTELVATFSVARNPDPASKLAYLVRLPLPGGPLVLKAADTWPRTAKVYCHRAEDWPERPEIVDQAPVRSCVRRGAAIDLVLDRPRNNRSQVIFTTIKGREGIFWQTPKTTRASRPGVRVPVRRASGLDDLVISVDTRERYPFRFARQQAATERRALPVGDYGVEHRGEILAVVERKSLADLASSVIDGSLTYALAEMATLPHATVVVEDAYSAIFKLAFAPPGFIADLLGALQVRYPAVPVIFCGTRPLAEEWTYRYLGAALAQARQGTP
jgi:ERCC4 domain